ncbi:thioredoxin-like protein [Zopfochytrium polystomum]|nr:thioredoxin-like protein [Zopfochytrium polystomum]
MFARRSAAALAARSLSRPFLLRASTSATTTTAFTATTTTPASTVLGLLRSTQSRAYIAKVRDPAPHFTAEAVVGQEFKTISLDDYKGKWLVLFFYPLDFTFVCPTEIIAFSERVDEFKALGCEVVAASVDSKHSHLAWINTPRKEGGLGAMKIPVLSDITKQISADYGVLIEKGGDIGVALRGTFIIDPAQVVRQITVNDLPVGRSVDETLRLVEALQFADKHGEVCPAGWKKGEKTMFADPLKSKEYFQAVN